MNVHDIITCSEINMLEPFLKCLRLMRSGMDCSTFHAPLLLRLNQKHTTVQLIMDQVDFGVRNCCTGKCHERSEPCGKNCKTVFIYKVTIQVSPKSWAQDCRRLHVQPYLTTEVFGLQRSVTLSTRMPLDPRQASVTYLRASTVSSTALEIGWSPARTDDSSNSVSWQWELYRYSDGKKLEFRPTWGTRPRLRMNQPDQMHIHPGSFPAEASWELPPNAELQKQQLPLDVKVALHTAVLRSKRRLPGYSVTLGPIVTFDEPLVFS